MEMWLGRQWQDVTRSDTSVGEEQSTLAMRMPYIRSCLVQLFLDSNFPLLRNYRIPTSATFPLLNVLDLLLSTIISLLSVLGLLWHEIFRLLNPTARLFSSILMLQSPRRPAL